MTTPIKKPLSERILAIQSEIGALSKDLENPFFKSKYFDINQVVEQLSPLLEKHGVTVTQPLTHLDGVAMIETIVESGSESRSYLFPLPAVEKSQEMGAAITYYRRYCLQSYFLLQAEDDDGNGRKKPGKPPKAQTTTQKFEQAKKMIKNTKKEDISEAYQSIEKSTMYNQKQKDELNDILMVRSGELGNA